MKRLGIAAVVVLALLATGGVLAMGPLQTNSWVLALFGPPRPELTEAYADDPGTAEVDHRILDGLLRRHVQGYSVDYDGLAAEEGRLDAYLAVLADAPFDALSRDGKLALLINAYNAFTLKLILDHRPLSSIKDIPADQRWDAKRWTLGGRSVSLTELEHEELRARFVEPRIHFAINCASVGCPPLRAEAYDPARIDEQLETQAKIIHHDARWLEIDGATVHLTPLYLWYQSDFEQVAGSHLAFASRYRPELAEGSWTVVWKDYDWSLNAVP